MDLKLQKFISLVIVLIFVCIVGNRLLLHENLKTKKLTLYRFIEHKEFLDRIFTDLYEKAVICYNEEETDTCIHTHIQTIIRDEYKSENIIDGEYYFFRLVSDKDGIQRIGIMSAEGLLLFATIDNRNEPQNYPLYSLLQGKTTRQIVWPLITLQKHYFLIVPYIRDGKTIGAIGLKVK